jgi:hypothetical protein
MDRINQNEPQQCFKLVAIDDEGRYVSIYDGTTEYKVGETITQEVRAGADCCSRCFCCHSERSQGSAVLVCGRAGVPTSMHAAHACAFDPSCLHHEQHDRAQGRVLCV